jgi:hypothetical protein
MYDFIIINPKKALRVQKREIPSEKTCKSSSQIFSVPSGSKKISKIDGRIIIEEILSIAKPLDALRFVYKNRFILYSLYKDYCENNIDYMIVRDVFFFVFFVAIIVVFVIYCFKKFVIAKESKKNLLPVTWTEINTLIQEERELTNKKMNIRNLLISCNGQPDKTTNETDSNPKTSEKHKSTQKTSEADKKPITSEKQKSTQQTSEADKKLITSEKHKSIEQTNKADLKPDTSEKPLSIQQSNATKTSEKVTDEQEKGIFELAKNVTLIKMKNNPSQIDANIKKDFARLVIGINVGRSGESLINQKIIDYLETNKK